MTTNNPIETILNAHRELCEDTSAGQLEKITAAGRIFRLILETAADSDTISFTSNFARLSYISNRYQLSNLYKMLAHQLRRVYDRENYEEHRLDVLLEIAIFINQELIYKVWKNIEQHPKLSDEALSYFKIEKSSAGKFLPLIEALVTELNVNNYTLTFIEEREPDKEKTAKFDVVGTNDGFTRNLMQIHHYFKMPVHLNLIDVDIRDDGLYVPKAFVLHPDYLIDVTSVAENSSDHGNHSILYAIKKFRQYERSPHLMLGNLANSFLDYLINFPEIEFQSLVKDIFKDGALEWSLYTDDEVKDLFDKAHQHFINLKRVVKDDLPKADIDHTKVYLEPSFYSRDYGIQGRLDMLDPGSRQGYATIVELKSGKPFKANTYGISSSHYIQTLLYDMIIRSVFHNKMKPVNFILYSSLEENSLRIAPFVKEMQYDILSVRNDIVSIEQAFVQGPEMVKRFFSKLKVANFPALRGFEASHLQKFEDVFNTLSSAEKDYICFFSSFIAREHMLAKTGGTQESGTHQSALWLDSIESKKERFAVFNDLYIVKNKATEEDPILVLEKTGFTGDLANFRIGDIAILYPTTARFRDVLHQQLLKCTIIDINDRHITIRLRNTQRNKDFFIKYDYWNIEEDNLDSSYRRMYENLFNFAAADEEKRRLLLGVTRPVAGSEAPIFELDPQLTTTQQALIRKIFQAKNYFLLWGPPGTGKTSSVLKNLVALYHKYTTENILVVSYTNRAVDEICEAISDAGLKSEFIRIGSRYSTHPDFEENLLEVRARKLEKRQQIVDMVSGCRIYTSTISSLLGKPELFELKEFDTIIIDEASQILEPMLTGLLPRFKKFIMIGDHKQLPAVVRQRKEQSKITSEALVRLGFSDGAGSMFERLYRQCRKNGWDSAYGILSEQGRMHEKIMAYPNLHFYEGKLKPLDKLNRLFVDRRWKTGSRTQEILTKERMIFIPTESGSYKNWKTNIDEVGVVSALILHFKEIYKLNELDFTADSIGVITPYRAQIALIKSALKVSSEITIDTVERYQGGARDIIILSMCTNKSYQIRSLSSLSDEGVDRKLNVALTRAKEQLILIGNEEILSNSEDYRTLMDSCFVLEKSLLF
jgi:DNA replication ATP-dependent helicase Dna2